MDKLPLVGKVNMIEILNLLIFYKPHLGATNVLHMSYIGLVVQNFVLFTGYQRI